ncbi:Holliday junction resolvase RuvX [Ureaplasma sp. ES3154-GEN]|uniref:Holliday junction resolvase RuvX n=1 Tax=Ureaplasma sp. ES3154-GEN TaxID=2984844 RepID=UPI0021E77CC5|nr:Holliday junction resolvase RuvX [Ureaplasma sp. ES3154-GEN]MCV3743519.1 Holliday junction resolvase RuvX [Ureaplasma sp. ES3154-GEN]
MRKLAIDFGTKACGFAISDELNIIATGLSNFEYPNQDWKYIFKHIDEIFIRYQNQIDTLVIGYPTNVYDASANERTLLVRDFVAEIKKIYQPQNIKIILVDERFSTRIATQRLKDQNIKAAQRKKVKDKMAAVVILESVLR